MPEHACEVCGPGVRTMLQSKSPLLCKAGELASRFTHDSLLQRMWDPDYPSYHEGSSDKPMRKWLGGKYSAHEEDDSGSAGYTSGGVSHFSPRTDEKRPQW